MHSIALLSLASAALAVPAKLDKRTPTRSYEGDTLERRYAVNSARADAVKQTFQIGWDGYYQYAFPMDQLSPVTNVGTNPR
jgi:mannosyl-oligosaccharide alpha-1,2-mannosidase